MTLKSQLLYNNLTHGSPDQGVAMRDRHFKALITDLEDTQELIDTRIYALSEHLIAEETNIDATQNGATIAIPFVRSDISLADHYPIQFAINWESGTLTSLVINVKVGSTTNITGISIGGVNNATRYVSTFAAGLQKLTGTVSIVISTPAGQAGTFGVKVYGVSIN